MFNKFSIKLRFTLLTIILLTVVCIVLTATSIRSAGVIISSDVQEITLDHIERIENLESLGIPIHDTVPNMAINEVEKIRQKFANRQLISMIAVICAGTLVSYFLANKALKPITNLTNEIKSIDENNLNTRINEPDAKDEVALLAASFNQMLLKLNNAFENQKLFTQNVAHELKTPLTSIMANIDVIDMDENPSNEELLEVIEIAKKNIDRLSKIVNDILSINSSIDNLNQENINFNEMINDIEDELSDFIIEKNITIEKKGNSIIYGNKSLLYSAFYNLILNAIRYNKHNGSIDVECENGVIVISDTGIGIPKKNLNKIFEPFYCVDNSRSRELGGSGLGLSLVKSIIDKHNFKIKIESEMNVGTKVIITI